MTTNQRLFQVQTGSQPVIDRVRGSIDGDPELLSSRGTVKVVIPLVDHVSTYVVETCRDDTGSHGFIEAFTPEGMVRLYLPPKVMQALYRQEESIAKRARRVRGQRAAETARRKGVIPFQRKEDRAGAEDDDDGAGEEAEG